MSLENVTKALALFCLIASSAVFPSDATESEQAPVAPQSEEAVSAKASENDDMVCRMEKPLGSNMKKRVCRTKEQMAQEMESARKAASGSQKRQ